MFNRLHRFPMRQAAVAVAVACLPLTAFAWGSQAGDNGRMPIGADNEGPRQAIPNASTNDAPIQYQYQSSTRYYYVYPSESYMAQPAQPAYVETYPGYMTYYYTVPSTRVYRYETYPAPEYYVYSRPYYDSTYGADTGAINRCAPLYGAARTDCLHGAAPGG